MRILVTGATGFLGRALCGVLMRAGHSVVALSRRGADGMWESGGVIEHMAADLRDQNFCARLPSMIEMIVHLAQSPDYAAGTDGMRDMAMVNVTATAMLLDHAKATGCRQFVYASSGSVYEPYCAPLSEDTPLEPVSCYASTKYAGELIARPYSRDMTVTILRPFFIFGPNQRDRLMPDLAERIRNGVAVRLSGGADGLRINPIFVDDAAALIGQAIAERWSGCMNLGGPEIVSIRRLAEVIGRAINAAPRFESTPQAEPSQIVGSIEKLRKLASDFEFTPLERAIALTFTPDVCRVVPNG